jgi:hypothetical protein
MPASGEDSGAIAVAPADQSEAVVLDFIGPLRPGWHRSAEGRENGSMKPEGGGGGIAKASCYVEVDRVEGES